jgi:hypothetical protein
MVQLAHPDCNPEARPAYRRAFAAQLAINSKPPAG